MNAASASASVGNVVKRRAIRAICSSAFTIEQLETGVSVAEVSRAFEVHRSLLQRWQQEFRQAPATAFPGPGRRRLEPDRIAQLERKLGQGAGDDWGVRLDST